MIPKDIGVVDLMIGFPSADPRRHYANLRAMAKDTIPARWSISLPLSP